VERDASAGVCTGRAAIELANDARDETAAWSVAVDAIELAKEIREERSAPLLPTGRLAEMETSADITPEALTGSSATELATDSIDEIAAASLETGARELANESTLERTSPATAVFVGREITELGQSPRTPMPRRSQATEFIALVTVANGAEGTMLVTWSMIEGRSADTSEGLGKALIRLSTAEITGRFAT